jgi:hypothetical protein
MLKNHLQKLFAKSFYPAKSQNWYAEKGYGGSGFQDEFSRFLSSQKQQKARFYYEFKQLNLTRYLISDLKVKDNLDLVLLTPEKSISKNKPGEGLYFVFFQGSREYYEGRFRDMAIQAKETGASVLGFNPKGLGSSTGKTLKIQDIVDDGIAVINFLLLEKKINPSKIILQGNSLGGAVQEMVSEHFRKTQGFRFRQINSNSFCTLAAVLCYQRKVPSLEFFIKYIDFYIISIFYC